MKTFAPLQRLSVKDFDLVQLQAPHKSAPWGSEWPAGTWTLQLEGQIIFRLGSLVSAVRDPQGSDVVLFTERQVAEALFSRMLEVHNNAVSIGYKHGRETLQGEFRALLGMEEGE